MVLSGNNPCVSLVLFLFFCQSLSSPGNSVYNTDDRPCESILSFFIFPYENFFLLFCCFDNLSVSYQNANNAHLYSRQFCRDSERETEEMIVNGCPNKPWRHATPRYVTPRHATPRTPRTPRHVTRFKKMFFVFVFL